VSDLRLTWQPTRGAAALSLEANDLATEEGLETAVFLSLFLDRQAEPGDVLPDETGDKRGWWGDSFPVVPGDKMGSRLWLLARSKQQPEVALRAEEYAREALTWLLEDRVSDKVDVSARLAGNGVLALSVVIHRPLRATAEYRYNYVWASQEARRA
jgi:phage gp46-like protein